MLHPLEHGHNVAHCDDERSCDLFTHDCSSIPYPGSRDRQALFLNAASLHENKEKHGFG